MNLGDLVTPIIDEVLDFVYLWETSNFSGVTWNPSHYYRFTSKEYGIILCVAGEGRSKEVQVCTSGGYGGWALYDKVRVVQCR